MMAKKSTSNKAKKSEKTLAFSGHRPEKLPWGDEEENPRAIALKEEIIREVRKQIAEGTRQFICGMARGCDHYFAEAVLCLQDEGASVKLEAAVPYEGQAEHWSQEQRDRYYAILARCDKVTVLQTNYDSQCMFARNRYMVDCADMLLAVHTDDGKRSGTLHTIKYARQKGRQVIILPPEAQEEKVDPAVLLFAESPTEYLKKLAREKLAKERKVEG